MADGLLARVVAALEQQGWDVEHDDDAAGGLVLSPRDGWAEWPVVAQVGSEPDTVAIFSVLPEQVPVQHRPAVLDLMAQMNYGLVVGSFEMDTDDGDVQVRTSVDLEGVELDDAALAALLTRLVGANLATMETWVDALRTLAAGGDVSELVSD